MDFEDGAEVDVERAGDAVDDAHGLTALDALGEHGVKVFVGHPHGAAGGAHEAGAGVVGNEVGGKRRVGDGLLHGAIGVDRVGCHGAHLLAGEFVDGRHRPVFKVGGGEGEAFDGAGEFDGNRGVFEFVEEFDARASFFE